MIYRRHKRGEIGGKEGRIPRELAAVVGGGKQQRRFMKRGLLRSSDSGAEGHQRVSTVGFEDKESLHHV